MRVPAASSTTLRAVLAGPVRPAEWLGASASALYLITGSGTVLAVVTHDAVRLPGALVLATTSVELPLTALAPERHSAPAAVGCGRVEWYGPAGVVTVVGAREWAPSRVARGTPGAPALDTMSAAVAARDIGLDRERAAVLGRAGGDPATQFAAVAALLGRGPGLTPSGDDLVAGFLLGARAFGLAVPGAVAAVAGSAHGATTALSAHLLAHAVRGECVPEAAMAVAALTGRRAPHDALGRLLAVGHTSGAALARGILSAAASLSVVVAGGS